MKASDLWGKLLRHTKPDLMLPAQLIESQTENETDTQPGNGCSRPKFTIGTQKGETTVTSEEDILLAFDQMLEDPVEFATLASSHLIYGIAFVQAVIDGHLDKLMSRKLPWRKKKLHLEIGISEGKERRVFYTTCSEKDCRQAFLDFYHGTFQPQLSDFAPVDFVPRV